ncbi:conserved exported hypothetical protein [Phycicoccus elongatus Lp2]|uniref:Secreted protein n=1 Tax=Phycicoccus elongatus Lp2 TaxID=1193181 RepID=N0E4W4_9MICO|nr:hypothetical protein [Phycicoccus elongatus]CCH70980.1 conserved exported hypothetical protein [Phycicoccus elongatus Lp2]
MTRHARRRHRVLRTGACAILAASVAGIGMTTASRAAATPATVPLSPLAVSTDDVRPSQADVDAARAAVGAASTAATRAQASYDAAAIELSRTEGVMARAAAQAATAQAQLDGRNRELEQADSRAAALAQQATANQLVVRRDAALIWQDQGASDLPALLDEGGPQTAADLASAIEHISARRQAALERAGASAHAADEARRLAEVARSQQAQAAAEAQQAQDRATAALTQAAADSSRLSAQQDQALADLARLRGVALKVEQDRQDALAEARARAAAEAAARAAAEAAARAAAEAAAREVAARDATAKAAAQAAARSTGSGKVEVPATWTPSGGMSPAQARATARSMLGAYGFGDGQWGCLDSLWTGESSWNWAARNPSSGAYGIPQSLPASKMSSAGSDWLTNPATQIAWGLGYIKGRYGSPCAALAFWQGNSPHWY